MLKIKFLTTVFLTLCVTSIVYSQEIPTDPALISSGETLFKQNCASCHKVQEKLIGPALKNVYDRREIPWIISFVRNSQKLIADGDPIANDLYEEYGQVVMTSFDFADEEVLSIMAYVKDQTDNPPIAAVVTTEAGGVAADQGVPKTYLYLIIGGLILVFFLMLIVLGLLSSVMTRSIRLRKDLDEADEEVISQGFSLLGLFQNKAFVGMVAFVFTAIILKTGIDQLYTIGVQQGYQPEQPIAFSHAVHAGQFEIDCNYCHTGVRKSASANIPSVNICMNCHGQIVKGTNTGTAEIEKIYAAVENNQPIEWVRIHNLPDLAYFNHSQHVEVGEIECQTCHGEIQEMEVVQQHALLTMGWCIDCHRTTEINSKGNAYYDNLVELHDSPDPMTVEDIGGLECAKCHY
jgi:mono/diheme cytochrome c family protein